MVPITSKKGSLGSVLMVLASGTLLGTAGTAVALAPDEASTTTLGVARVGIGGLILILLLPLFGGDRKNLIKVIRRPGVWAMALSTAAFQPLFFGATTRTGVALSTVLTIGTMPLFTGLIGRTLFSERFKRMWVIATSLAVTGLVLRSWEQLESIDFGGVVMALGAGFATGCYVNGAKYELNRGGHAVELPAVAYSLSAVLLLPLVVGDSFTWITTGAGLLTAIYLGAISMALANTLQVVGLKRLSPGPTATLLLADPLTATILGIWILDEAITPLGVFGLIIVAVGLVLQGLAEHKT
ncbi:MAG: DMT family transporter [Candidatus Nanopelagicaceae bacterium]